MLPALALLSPEAVMGAVSGLLALFGYNKLRHSNISSPDLSDMFGLNDSSNVDVSSLDWSDDTFSTNSITNVIPTSLDEINSDVSNSDDVDADLLINKLHSYDNYLDNILFDVDKVKKSDDYSSVLNNLSNSLSNFDNVSLDDVSNSETLIDVLRLNGLNLNKSLSAINQNLVSLISILSAISVSSLKLNDDVKKGFADVVASNTLISKSLSLQTEALVKNLAKIVEAKKYEKEYYEFMKTPMTYNLNDEDLMSLSPREIIANSEAIKTLLNSQEATLTGEEVSDFEEDFDLGDLMFKLFNFKGIVEDIKRCSGGDK